MDVGWAEKGSSFQTFFSRYQFVISPRGKGIDCYRTWQALHVGSIPIVEASTINSLYEDLPIVVVERWTDLSAEMLERHLRAFEGNWSTMRWEKLTNGYWKGLMEQAVQRLNTR